jgi:ArsR family transcriptional regulator
MEASPGQIAPGPSRNVRSDPVYVVKARLLRTLGHPVRIRILELLLERELGVGELQSELELDSSGTSQHLSALRQVGLVDSRRAGTSVFYRIKEPRVAELLAVAKLILTATLSDSRALLSDLTAETHAAQS